MTEVSQAEYARYRKVSRKTVSTWKAQGYLVLSASGKVDVAASDKKVDGRPVENRGGVTNRLPAVTPVHPGNSVDAQEVTTSEPRTAETAIYFLLWELRHAAAHAAVQAGASAPIAYASAHILFEIALDYAAEALNRAGLGGYDVDAYGSDNDGQKRMAAELNGGREPYWECFAETLGQAINIEDCKTYLTSRPWWREFMAGEGDEHV